MRDERFIKRLIIVTVIVLFSIVGLQIYWLSTSYKQERSRFSAGINDALSSANVKTTLKKALSVKNNELLQAIDVNSLQSGTEKNGQLSGFSWLRRLGTVTHVLIHTHFKRQRNF
jgi:hypothetical protein